MLMNENPFGGTGRWFRGCLHIHTTGSDGRISPAEVSSVYRGENYDFIAITDHGKVTDVNGLTTEGFLVLTGGEYSKEGLHVTAVNISTGFSVENFSTMQEIIDGINADDGSCIIAHPYWSALTIDDIKELDGYMGVEVYNTTCELEIGRGFSSIHWDALLSLDRRCWGFAVDDAHFNIRDYCQGWIMVKARELEAGRLLESLHKGLFYSSSGPVILDLRVSDESISVKCSPAAAVNFVCNDSIGGSIHLKEEEVITSRCSYQTEKGRLVEAVYPLRGKESYVRVEIVGERGERAWSNPFFLKW